MSDIVHGLNRLRHKQHTQLSLDELAAIVGGAVPDHAHGTTKSSGNSGISSYVASLSVSTQSITFITAVDFANQTVTTQTLTVVTAVTPSNQSAGSTNFVTAVGSVE